MKNKVYVRSNRSITTISLTRLILILPLIIYGIYKNGVYLYRNNYVNVFGLLKPVIIILGGMIIAGLINFLYEYFIKKHRNENIVDALFSSFHIEYAALLGCIMSINVDIYIYFIVLTVILIISKFIGDRANTICLAFLVIYTISSLIGGFEFANIYEASKTFSYELIDYLIGRTPGGIASTHIILLVVALIGLSVTNNNKTTISVISIASYILIVLVYSLVTKNSFHSILTCNNFLFIASFVATDSVTSCYTNRGMILFGISVSLLSFGLYFVNPILAPILAVLIISLFTHIIDEKIYLLAKNKQR